jgi:hypothetical protein
MVRVSERKATLTVLFDDSAERVGPFDDSVSVALVLDDTSDAASYTATVLGFAGFDFYGASSMCKWGSITCDNTCGKMIQNWHASATHPSQIAVVGANGNFWCMKNYANGCGGRAWCQTVLEWCYLEWPGNRSCGRRNTPSAVF